MDNLICKECHHDFPLGMGDETVKLRYFYANAMDADIERIEVFNKGFSPENETASWEDVGALWELFVGHCVDDYKHNR